MIIQLTLYYKADHGCNSINIFIDFHSVLSSLENVAIEEDLSFIQVRNIISMCYNWKELYRDMKAPEQISEMKIQK
jgi:hypothetical protein